MRSQTSQHPQRRAAFPRLNAQQPKTIEGMQVIHTHYTHTFSFIYTQQTSQVVQFGVGSTHITELFDCTFGVQQGSVLSPLLFTIFVNDIGQSLANTCQFSGVEVGILKIIYLLFADDLTLVSSSRIGLQRLLNQLYEYCCKWKLSVNTDKTKIIVFRRGGGLKNYEKWFYNGQRVSVISFYSYLGVVFSWTGLWFQAQKALSEQASRALFCLTNSLHKFGTLPVDIALKIFDAKILPILLYGTEIEDSIQHRISKKYTIKCYA